MKLRPGLLKRQARLIKLEPDSPRKKGGPKTIKSEMKKKSQSIRQKTEDHKLLL